MVPVVNLLLPGLKDVIDGLRGCISLEKLSIIEGLGQHVPKGVEGGNQLSLSGVVHLEGRSYVAELVAERHLTKDRFVNDSGEDRLDALSRHDLVSVLTRLILSD